MPTQENTDSCRPGQPRAARPRRGRRPVRSASVGRWIAQTVALAALVVGGRARAAEPPSSEVTTEVEPVDPRAAPPPPPEVVRTSSPTPLEVDYAQYGVALSGELLIEPGAICPDDAATPCIVESGAGPLLRGGYRPSGPWYVGGAYQFTKLDSNNLYRLGILQSLYAEGRFYFDVGVRVTPYLTWALGGAIYGNEFSADTAGALTFLGAGLEFELSRFAVVGLAAAYEPVLLASFQDSTSQERNVGISQFAKLSLVVELRTELTRE